MHVALLTLLLVTGAEEPSIEGLGQPTMIVESSCDYGSCGECCHPVGRCCGREERPRGYLAACFGPMPQACYAPRFRCYPGNNRHMHRYPAFHGCYYRRAYNYRHLFDYPWHAAPYEPQGLSTRQGGRQIGQEVLTPIPQQDGMPSETPPHDPLSPKPAGGGY